MDPGRQVRRVLPQGTRPGRQELVAFCEAVGRGEDVLSAATSFGRESCGLLTESELVSCVRAVLHQQEREGIDLAAVIAAARLGHSRQAEAFRFTELLIDPLNGLDSESRFLADLWGSVSLGHPTWLMICVPIEPTTGSWERGLTAGVLRWTTPGLLGVTLLASGAVVGRTGTAESAHRCLAELTGRLPGLVGRVVRVGTVTGIADLAWWLVCAVAATTAMNGTDSGSVEV